MMFAELDALYTDLRDRKAKRLARPAFFEDVSKARLNSDYGLSEDYLNVVAISFGSPGFSDFFGAAGLLSEIRQFIQFLVEHFRTRELRKLEEEQIRLEITSARLALLDKISEAKRRNVELATEAASLQKPSEKMSKELEILREDFGLSAFVNVDETLSKLDALSALCWQGKIKDAEIYDPQEKTEG